VKKKKQKQHGETMKQAHDTLPHLAHANLHWSVGSVGFLNNGLRNMKGTGMPDKHHSHQTAIRERTTTKMSHVQYHASMMFMRRLSFIIMTPLGFPVVPLVYNIVQISDLFFSGRSSWCSPP
jgi:hypothetical protein